MYFFMSDNYFKIIKTDNYFKIIKISIIKMDFYVKAGVLLIYKKFSVGYG